MKALDRTDFGTVGIFTLDAIFGNDIGHELVTFFTERFRAAGVAASLADEVVFLDEVLFFAAGVLALPGFFTTAAVVSVFAGLLAAVAALRAGFLVLFAAALRAGAAFLAGGARFSRGGGGV